MKKIFKKQYEVTYRDVDPRGECRLTSYMDFMADAGLSQDETYGFVIADLCKDDYTWMLVDYEIKVYKYAKYKDRVTVVTYIEGMNKFYALRCFKIYDKDENLILDGKTLVILVDVKRRRPMSISSEHYEAYGVEEKDISIGKNKIKLRSCENVTYEKKFNINYSDIDLNSHVGNVNYVQWVLETIPLNIMKKYRVDLVKIKYKKELTYGEEIIVQSEVIENKKEIVANHEIFNESGESVALLESHWEKV